MKKENKKSEPMVIVHEKKAEKPGSINWNVMYILYGKK